MCVARAIVSYIINSLSHCYLVISGSYLVIMAYSHVITTAPSHHDVVATLHGSLTHDLKISPYDDIIFVFLSHFYLSKDFPSST